ncbi:MAG TPA: hypothetical protein VFB23_01165 [Candidatus Acidoferrales bacterium]|jgi:hypothetical protein|nr:hypothetical protein [Candidatus Acidoferrales bacterium]
MNSLEKLALKFPLELKCENCSEASSIKIRLDESSFDWKCPKCGFVHTSLFGLDVTIGVRLLERSRYELTVEQDFSMAIVMAAMGLESEVSRLFDKWKSLDADRANLPLTREQCEEELRRMGTIDRKIDAVSQLLVNQTMDDFVSAHMGLREMLPKFPSLQVGSLAEGFQQNLFWPRNKILHWGEAKDSYDEAARCWSIAALGVRILREMDLERRKCLN